MENSDNELSSLRDGHWKVQPGWVKAYKVPIEVPAFLVLVSGTVRNTLQNVALSAFVAVALLQLAFVFRAYWRMDL